MISIEWTETLIKGKGGTLKELQKKKLQKEKTDQFMLSVDIVPNGGPIAYTAI